MRNFGKLLVPGLRDKHGNAATLFALTAVPAFALLGFGVDYGIGLSNKAKLDAAVDAAAMSSVTTAQNVIQNAPPGANVDATATSQAQTAAARAFQANVGRLPFASAPTLTTNTMMRSGQTLTATVTYSASIVTNMSKIIGIQTMNVSNTATATLSMATYINYYILVDTSQSMGIGATATDMQNLYNRVIANNNYDSYQDANNKVGCVFGCHSAAGPQTTSNEDLARNPRYGTPIPMRIDSAKSAVQTILNDASKANTNAGVNLIQVAVYGMQQDPTNPGSYIQPLSSPPSSDFTSISNKVSAMTLGNNNSGGVGDTGFSNSLDYFVRNILPSQGDGSSSSSPLNYVFLISDGLGDVPGPCMSGHCTSAFNDTFCTPIKNKATVGVIYTTYLPIYYKNDASQGYDANYRNLAMPYVGSIPGNLQACASRSNLYFEASDGPAITTGLQKLFASTASQARFTQ